ncbi:MAG: transglycosylase SLT domain-containing protein [Candidatus Wallbacteria bacterium]|nr:transglycosylase SLT domain-containing protein [Candidatus Wallbacteria bacterium]
MKQVLCFFLMAVLSTRAAIYSYRDDQGNIFITDKPKNEHYQILVTSRKQPKDLMAARGFHQLLETGGEYQKTVAFYSHKFEVSPALILAMIKAESNFDPDAVSKAGAKGLMQLMPGTCSTYKVKDPFNADDNIRAGTHYFSSLLTRFKEVELALAAYNAGPSRVTQYKGIPPFHETQNYVKKVNWYYKYYQKNEQNLKLAGVSGVFKDGFLEFSRGSTEKAIESFAKVLEKYPDSPEVNYNLALAYDQCGAYTQAVIHYLRALSLDPFLKESYYNLAIVYEKIGLNFKAVSSWQKYLELEIDPLVGMEVKGFVKELIKLMTQE